MERIPYLFAILSLLLVNQLLAESAEIVADFKIPHLSPALTKIHIVEKKERLHLLLKPSEAVNECSFDIRAISAPQQTRGREGAASVYAKKCTFLISNVSLKNFWDEILSVALFYHWHAGKWVRLSSLAATYTYPLEKIAIK